MKTLALDLGDVWTGIAISDALGITARPLYTAKTPQLASYLSKLFDNEMITTVVVGLPTTMRGTQSDQTKSVIAQQEILEQKFPQVKWMLWDERLSSKRAAATHSAKTKEEKIASHAIAAAFILQTYLDNQAFNKMNSDSIGSDD